VGRGKPRKVLIDMAGRQDQRIHGDLPPRVRHWRRRTQAAIPRCEVSLLKKA